MLAAGKLQGRRAIIDLEYWYLIFALLLMTGSFTPLIYKLFGQDDPESYTDSNPYKLILNIAIYVIATLLMAPNIVSATRTAWQSKIFLLVVMLPVISVLWSVDHEATLKRATAHALTCIFCLYIANRMTARDFLGRLLWVLCAGGIASLLYIVIFPQYGITQTIINHGSWQGIYGHKVELGRIGSIAMLLAITLPPQTRLENIRRLVVIVCFAPLLIGAESRTNWVIVVAGLCFLPVFRILREQRIATWVRLLVIITSFTVAVLTITLGADIILESVGRDSTFSGRVTLWRSVAQVVSEHYFPLGAGYGAFFSENGGLPEMRYFLRYWIEVPNHAHSGYWQTWADLGVPGIVTLVLLLGQISVRLVKRLMADQNPELWTPWAMMLFMFLVLNYANSETFKHTDISWVLLLLSLLYSGRVPQAAVIREPARTKQAESRLQDAPV